MCKLTHISLNAVVLQKNMFLFWNQITGHYFGPPDGYKPLWSRVLKLNDMEVFTHAFGLPMPEKGK